MDTYGNEWQYRHFLNIAARGPPGSVNKSARGVNHVPGLGDQRTRETGGGCREGADVEMQQKEKQWCNDVKLNLRAIIVHCGWWELDRDVTKPTSSHCQIICIILRKMSHLFSLFLSFSLNIYFTGRCTKKHMQCKSEEDYPYIFWLTLNPHPSQIQKG